MSKKTVLIAIAVASMTMFALPAAASAQEDHIDGITAFSGTGTPVTISASGEPKITCEGAADSGSISAGGTTGNLFFDFTGCHVNVIFTIPCHTIGAPLNNTIKASGTFHTITVNSHPGIMWTLENTVIECAGISTMTISGNGVLGTITSPNCNVESKEVRLEFSYAGTTQNHISYTGVNYDLKSQTSGGSLLTAGMELGATLKSPTAGKVTCT
jgi:hypothetical protein